MDLHAICDRSSWARAQRTRSTEATVTEYCGNESDTLLVNGARVFCAISVLLNYYDSSVDLFHYVRDVSYKYINLVSEGNLGCNSQILQAISKINRISTTC